MKLKLILLILMCGFGFLKAQKSTPQQYIAQYAPLAQKEMQRVGVPAAITLAQGILESESGNSELAAKSNNHFGIKCKSNWEGEKVFHNDDAKGECFRKYENVEQSYIDHSDFLKINSRYSFLFELDKTDYQGWAKGLKKAGYATNPVYAQKLIELIEKYQLHNYNTIVTIDRILVDDTTKNIAKVEEKINIEKPEKVIEKNTNSIDITNEELDKQYGQKIFIINQAKAINVLKGTSLLAIANKYGISFSKLLEMNDWNKNQTDIVETDIVVFLQKKRKQGATPIHIVKENETLHQIAQIEGIKLENLMKMNNVNSIQKLKTGQQIYLQSKSIPSK